MRIRTTVVAGAVVVAAAGALAPAQAGPPKPFAKSVTFTDDTPDPTGYLLGSEHCLGELPREKPVRVVVPAAGVVDIAISGFTGEWSLLITEPSGKVVGSADADAPKTEATTLRLKKATTIDILPCNLFGTSEAKLTYSYRYKKALT